MDEQPVLLVREGQLVGQRWTIDRDEYIIGRGGESNLVLPERQVSRHHVKILNENGRYLLQDLGSKNGTYVNDEPIQSTILNNGDVITIGKYKILFQTQSNELTTTVDMDQTVIIPNFHKKEQDSGFNINFPVTSDVVPRLFRRSKMEEYPLSKEKLIVGKGKDSDIKIGGLFGPRVKVEIIRRGNDFVLQKLEGSAKVKINGEEMDEKVLEEEDLITIGKEEFVFKR